MIDVLQRRAGLDVGGGQARGAGTAQLLLAAALDGRGHRREHQQSEATTHTTKH